ncbi:MAG: ParB/RepB/Spo0J family partition protein [Geminicoccaceae bacterium]|nr:ParB/RepB/Spo0J family partition protein [Geminicoccaceae bacterium]MCS7268187.1 ParB/RepB/Spo0J family partition protein [Geminicoccaceae bacterium]MDW8125925.1 ParB/RepB/Spo0J family partition protein [Geminicoccaceae bacterium]MDW8341666.1 ParB/RepB/Spo0J family partition protein [Geminicoccaceae bacterium]MDW8444030.1 ParB/RepB/Spo0J family partition protein [Acetobacteraceae bacterium]
MRQTDKRAALSASIAALREETPASGAGAARGIVGRALELHREGLLERLKALESARGTADPGDLLVRIDPARIDDPLPPDRHPRAFADAAFAELKRSIAERGQDSPIVVRAKGERFELATGRRRLAVCRELGIPVLARVLPLDEEGMLALQYRENEERANVSAFERGRWFARLAEAGWSTTRLAALTGLSQPSIVAYLKLGRLPEALIEGLSEPRALTLKDGARLTEALEADPGALARMVAALSESSGRPVREQLARALAAARGAPSPKPKLAGRAILDREGRKLATLTRSGNQWILRWAPAIEEEAIAWIAARLPELVHAWRSGAVAKSADGAEHEEGSARARPSGPES